MTEAAGKVKPPETLRITMDNGQVHVTASLPSERLSVLIRRLERVAQIESEDITPAGRALLSEGEG